MHLQYFQPRMSRISVTRIGSDKEKLSVVLVAWQQVHFTS